MIELSDHKIGILSGIIRRTIRRESVSPLFWVFAICRDEQRKLWTIELMRAGHMAEETTFTTLPQFWSPSFFLKIIKQVKTIIHCVENK